VLCMRGAFECYRGRCERHSFPTRRSSDLGEVARYREEALLAHGVHHRQLPPLQGIALVGIQLAHQRGERDVLGQKQILLTIRGRSEEHTSELQSRENLVCRLLLEKKKLQ